MDVQEAMDAGRFRHVDGTRVIVEPAIPDSVIAQLKAMGHDVSIAQAVAVRREPGDHQAGARLRRGIGPAKGWARCWILTGRGPRTGAEMGTSADLRVSDW